MKINNIELTNQIIAENAKGHKAYCEPLEFFIELAQYKKWLIDTENQIMSIPVVGTSYDEKRGEYYNTTHECKTLDFEQVIDSYNQECKELAFTFFKTRDYIVPSYTYENQIIKYEGIEIDVNEFVEWIDNNSSQYLIGRSVVFNFENMSVKESYTTKSYDVFFQDNIEDMEWWLESYADELNLLTAEDIIEEINEAYLLRIAS